MSRRAVASSLDASCVLTKLHALLEPIPGMPTYIVTGQSSQKETGAAVREAVLAALGSATRTTSVPSLGFLFLGPAHRPSTAVRVMAALCGSDEVLVCSTAGEFTEGGLTHGGVAAMLVFSDEMVVETATKENLAADPRKAAMGLAETYRHCERRARERGWALSTSVVLVDGLVGAGEKFIAELLHATRPYLQIVGGAAGDEGAFRSTHVGTRQRIASDAVAVAHCFGPRLWGVGVGHGLEASSPRMTVTRAQGNVVFEIDGRPAFEAYRDHARQRGTILTPYNASAYMIANELGVYFLDGIEKARAPLTTGADGSLTCAASIPAGSGVCILEGRRDAMIDAVREATSEALTRLGTAQPAGALVFDCICRGQILGEEFGREIEAVRSIIGDRPVAGFLTYGEIARYRGRLAGWHNATAVVVLIPE